MDLNRTLRWRGLDPESLEHCHVAGNRIRGTIITPDYGLFYRLKLDDAGPVRTVRIDRTDGKVLELFSDGAGNWSDDRAEPLSELRGCIDIDLWPTPLTNSLPLWRTDWTDNQPQRVALAWIDGDTMRVSRQEQIYTRLDQSHFRFETASFDCVLEVDADMLVIDYPGLFVRAD